MRVPRVYIESSVFNFMFADDAPDKRNDTQKLFDEIKAGLYEPYTSEYVVRELSAARAPKRENMLSLIKQYDIIPLPADEETERLAAIYVMEGVIPAKYGTDAIHIACVTVNDLDFIVSFNFKHIVKRKTMLMTGAINLREGYKQIGIFSPTEVI
jgi:predicted nucleic acid-binding protein